MISLRELPEKPLEGAVSGILHLFRQRVSIGLLSATKKDICADDNQAEQFLNSVNGHRQMGFDGLAGLDGFRRGGRAVSVQSFLSRDLRGDGLPQFFMMHPRQVSKQQWAFHARCTGIIQHGLFVVIPAVSHPQCDLILAGSRLA